MSDEVPKFVLPVNSDYSFTEIKKYEAHAKQVFEEHFPEYECICVEIIKLLESLLPDRLGNNQLISETAVHGLLARLITDVYAIFDLASRGYGIQSVTLAASSFEIAWMTLYIGFNDERAEAWLGSTAKDVGSKIKERIETVLQEQEINETELENTTNYFYKEYEFLCMIKHGNWRIQGLYHYNFISGSNKLFALSVGPNSSLQSIWLGSYAIGTTIKSIARTIQAFMNLKRATALKLIQLSETNNQYLKKSAGFRQQYESEVTKYVNELPKS